MSTTLGQPVNGLTKPEFGPRFWLAGSATAVAALVLSFAIHGGLLAADYTANAAAYRPLATQYDQWQPLLGAYLLNSFGLVWFYQRAVGEGAPLRLIVGFGVAVALTFTSFMYLINYVVLPIQPSLAIKQIACDSLGVVALSLLISRFYCISRRA